MKKILNNYLLVGLLGVLLTLMFGWEWNMAVIVWVGLFLLVRFFRNETSVWKIVLISLLLLIAKTFVIHGGWDVGIGMEFGFSIMTLAPMFVALFADRYFSKRITEWYKYLIFPIILTVLDYLLGFSLIGTVFSLGVTQYAFDELRQLSSITGIWGITFMLAWFASTLNALVENNFDLSKTKKNFNVFVFVMAIVLIYGGVKLTFVKSNNIETVKIAGITVEHSFDLWQVTDDGTLPQNKQNYIAKITAIQNALFEKSQQAADFGAKIIFWSEGNAPVYEDDYATLIAKAKDFANTNDVYLMASLLVYKYNTQENLNIVVSINPDGDVLDIYEKTISWYPSTSDGILPVMKTEYGNISVVICFDLDFPVLVKQAADNNIDILIVPAYDTEKISPYHTEVGLFRSVDYGINIFRQVNKGTSIAVDYNGNILGYQHYFNTDNKTMVVDVPIKGISTVYGYVGDLFVYVNILGLVTLVSIGIYKKTKAKKRKSKK